MESAALQAGPKPTHMALVLLSDVLFALRDVAVLQEVSRGGVRPVCLASEGIDTLLLLAGTGLELSRRQKTRRGG